MEFTRIIKTGVKATAKALELFQSISGQMSDGIWENSPNMDKYWLNFEPIDVDGEVAISVPDSRWGESRSVNGFYNMTDAGVVNYFATKIYQIAHTYIKDNKYYYGNSCTLAFSKDCDALCEYVGYDENITLADMWAVKKTMMKTVHALKAQEV